MEPGEPSTHTHLPADSMENIKKKNTEQKELFMSWFACSRWRKRTGLLINKSPVAVLTLVGWKILTYSPTLIIFDKPSSLLLYYLKVDVESCRISCSHHHETLDFDIRESWSHYEKIRVKICNYDVEVKVKQKNYNSTANLHKKYYLLCQCNIQNYCNRMCYSWP